MSRLQRSRRCVPLARGVIGLALLTSLVAGCASSSRSKAGADARRVTVLRLATGDRGAPLNLYADEVSRLSGGTLRIEVVTRRDFTNPVTNLDDVTANKVQIGSLSTDGLVGGAIDDFQALTLPMLIDSYRLQQRVLTSGLVPRMLRGLRVDGFVGITILPGAMQRALGVRKPFRRVRDFAGARFSFAGGGDAGEWAPVALGATPYSEAIGPTLGDLDGAFMQLSAIDENQYYRVAKAVTTNVVYRPDPWVFFTSRKLWATLSRRQRNVLLRAGLRAVPRYAEAKLADDRESAARLCRAGMQLARATRTDIAALRAALRPVYRRIEQDPKTRRFVRAIERMRSGSGPEDLPSCPARTTWSTDGKKTPLDGVYRRSVTRAAQARLDQLSPEQEVVGKYGRWTWIFDRGYFAQTHENDRTCTWAYGTFTRSRRGVELAIRATTPPRKRRLQIGHVPWWAVYAGGPQSPRIAGAEARPGDLYRFSWSLYRGELTLTFASPAILGRQVWQRVSETPSSAYLSRHCAPPARALPH